MGIKIGVFGDSFADRNTDTPFKNESWLNFLEQQGHKVMSYAKAGTSTWYSYEKFCSHYEQFDQIVFCYSSIGRTPVLPKGLEIFSTLKSVDELYASQKHKILNIEQELTLVRFLTGRIYIQNSKFDLFLQQKIFDDVNLICKEKNIKLVNILTFDGEDKNKSVQLQSRHGDCLYNLYSISAKDSIDWHFVDSRSCHLSMENNRVLAEIILESLNSDSKNIIDLKRDSRFVYNPEITKRYCNIK